MLRAPRCCEAVDLHPLIAGFRSSDGLTGSYNTSTTEAVDQAFLYGAMRIRCGSNEHNELTVLASSFIAVWPIGMPLLLLGLLILARQPAAQDASFKEASLHPMPRTADAGRSSRPDTVDSSTDTTRVSIVARATALLSKEYEPLSHFWEVRTSVNGCEHAFSRCYC